jgi:hypothetical protein
MLKRRKEKRRNLWSSKTNSDCFALQRVHYVCSRTWHCVKTCSLCPQLNLTLRYNVFRMSAAELDIELLRVHYVRSWTWHCITTCSLSPQLNLTLRYNVFIKSAAELDIELLRVHYVRSWTWHCITTCSLCPQLNLTLRYNVFSISTAELDVMSLVQNVHPWTIFWLDIVYMRMLSVFE